MTIGAWVFIGAFCFVMLGLLLYFVMRSTEAECDKRYTDEELNSVKKANKLRRRYRDSAERERLRKDKR